MEWQHIIVEAMAVPELLKMILVDHLQGDEQFIAQQVCLSWRHSIIMYLHNQNSSSTPQEKVNAKMVLMQALEKGYKSVVRQIMDHEEIIATNNTQKTKDKVQQRTTSGKDYADLYLAALDGKSDCHVMEMFMLLDKEFDCPLTTSKNARLLQSKAARNGLMKVLRWLKYEKKVWSKYDALTCRCAAAGGHLQVLKWL